MESHVNGEEENIIKPSVIDELFGSADNDATEDIFAQLGATQNHDDSAQEIESQHDETTLKNEISPASRSVPVPKASEIISSHPPQSPPPSDVQSKVQEETEDPNPLVAFHAEEKDYSQLLAEFEGDVDLEGLPDQQYEAIAQDWQAEVNAASDDKLDFDGVEATQTGSQSDAPPAPAAPITAAALFADDPTFDAFLPIESEQESAQVSISSPPSPSPVPSLSIENSFETNDQAENEAGNISVQSLFTDTSDWLADTTVDDSFVVGAGDGAGAGGGESSGTIVADDRSKNPTDPAPFEVPEGWYDENGEWQWYTEEDKEQVRLAMLGQTPGWSTASAVTEVSAQELAAPFTPNLSENAARRTPQPDSPAIQSSLDPYVPQTYAAPTSSNPVYPAPNATSSSYLPPTAGHAPAANASFTAQSTSSYAAPAASSSTYDPYAPVAQAYTSPYAPSAPVSAYTRPSGSSFQQPKPKVELPKAPQRMVSTAYDPPFLRPSKSFAKIPSAVPTPVPFAVAQTSLTMSPPPVSSTPPPPTGPPRRPKAEQKPSYAPPPPPSGIAKSKSYAALSSSSQNTGFDPPLRSGSTHRQQSTQYQPLSTSPIVPPVPKVDYDRYRNVQPPQQSFDMAHPPTQSRAPQSMSTLSPPAPNHDRLPIAPLAPPRKASPMFEPRPPSLSPRPSNNQYSQRGTSDDFSPVHAGENSHQRRESFDRVSSRSQERSPPIPRGHGELAPPIQSVLSEFEAEVNDDPEAAGRWQDDGDEMTQHEGARDVGAREVDSYQDQGYTPYQPAPVSSHRQHAHFETDRQNNAFGEQHDLYGLKSSAPDPGQNYIPQIPQSSYEPAPHTNHEDPTQYRPPQNVSTSYDPHPYVPPSAPSQSFNTVPIIDPYNRMPTPSHTSEYGISPQAPNYFRSPVFDDTYVPPQIAEQRPVSEDPLRRCSIEARNAPLAIFGFGGMIITAFPALGDILSGTNETSHARTPSYGYASHRGQLWIRNVSDLVAPSAINSNDAAFPGPLILDSSTPKGSAGEKKKREAVMAYLEARAVEIEKGLPFLRSSASLARREEEGKLVLVRTLLALVVGDGQLIGNQKAEDALRIALQNPNSPSSIPASTVLPISNGFSSSLYPSKSATSAAATPSQLEQLSAMLLDGNKQEAALFAANVGLWSHALVISSSVDQELWREIVSRFTQAELGSSTAQIAALKACYALFSGQTLNSVDDLVQAARISEDPSADQWRQVISAVIFNGKPTDLACLDELGGRFTALGLREAAHVCHLLSPSTPFADVSVAAFDKVIEFVNDARDEDGIIFSEIAEYARSLLPIPKGLETPLPGLPQLLPYKLQRAWQAAELGDVEQAQRYCTAVEAGSKIGKTGQTLLPRTLAASLEDLVERLTGSPSPNPARIIGGRKTTAKPGLDSLGSWIEGRLTKFIAGDEVGNVTDSNTTAAAGTAKSGSTGVVGPFSHFSTISSNADLPRAGSIPDFSIPSSGLYSHPDSRRPSPGPRSMQASHSGHGVEASQASASSYGEQMANGYDISSSYSPWGVQGDDQAHDREADGHPAPDDEGGDFINPMAQLSLNTSSQSSYDPSPAPLQTSRRADEDDDEEDLGFGNRSISRGKTPRPETGPSSDNKTASKNETAKSEEPAASPAKSDAKPAGWLGKWWGKKEGQPSGPIKAKLGEESSMIYDKELKRWVVKGSTPEAAPGPPPPPPRAQTASPSRSAPQGPAKVDRASSATPPPSQAPPSRMSTSSSHAARTASVPNAFSESPDGGIRRMKSSLQESITASDMSSGGGGPPPPPMPAGSSRPPTSSRMNTSTSIDDLLSRPPSKRPASAAKKPMRNRYVDVFQPGADGA